MSATNNLLDKYRGTCYARSDNAIAVSLGVSRTAVSRWVHGEGHPDAENVEKMAMAIREPVGPWLAQIEAQRASSANNRKVWLRLAATFGTTLAVAMMLAPAYTAAPASGQSTSLSIVSNYKSTKILIPWGDHEANSLSLPSVYVKQNRIDEIWKDFG